MAESCTRSSSKKTTGVTTAMKQAGDSYYTKTKGKNTRRTPTGTASHPRVPSDVTGSGGKARYRWSALEVERDVGWDSIFSTREAACATVRVCKLMKTFKSTDMKIVIYIRHTEETSLVKALVKAGAKLQEGRAPAGGLARDIQKWLDTQAAV